VKHPIRKQKFKHFSGVKIATYFDAEIGLELFGPREFLEHLAEEVGAGQNSIDAAISDLFLFLKFLRVSSDLQIENGPWLGDTGVFLNRVILMYPVFLAEGERSTNSFVAEVAKELGFQALSKPSVGRHISTINQFMKFNHEEWISHQAMGKYFEVDTLVAEDALMEQLAKKTSLAIHEKRALLNQSMLAGVISGGPKKVSRPALRMPRRFGSVSTLKKKFYTKAFPLDRVLDLIDGASSYRDICLFSLLAGAGIRTHEAMQMRLEDVLVDEITVAILPYHERVQAYSDLDKSQIPKLAFKGRTSENVTFIRPFRDIFFRNLLNYLDEERDRTQPSHEFLFVNLANNANGDPWFLGDSKSHNTTFKATQKRIGMENIHSLHSLRHFYGTWLHNYQPNGDSFGYSLEVVQRAMGHKWMETTAGYALPDKNLYLRQMRNAVDALTGFGFDLKQVMQLRQES
jgi:integrase